jgi:hypothetical protein
MLAQAGGDGAESVVDMAGMADEFVCAFGHDLEEMVEGVCVEMAGGGDAEGSFGGEKGIGIELLEEGIVQALERAELEAANEAAALNTPRRFEGIAQSVYAAGGGGAGERSYDGREEMRVFVGVDVADLKAGVLQLADLCSGFAFDLGFVEAAEHEIADEDAKRRAETCAAH